MIQYSAGYPFRLVLLLSEDVKIVADALEELKVAYGAMSSAAARPFRGLRPILHRTPLCTTFMKWVFFFLSRTDFKVVPPQVVTLVGSMVNGPGQSRIVEDSTQRLPWSMRLPLPVSEFIVLLSSSRFLRRFVFERQTWLLGVLIRLQSMSLTAHGDRTFVLSSPG